MIIKTVEKCAVLTPLKVWIWDLSLQLIGMRILNVKSYNSEFDVEFKILNSNFERALGTISEPARTRHAVCFLCIKMYSTLKLSTPWIFISLPKLLAWNQSKKYFKGRILFRSRENMSDNILETPWKNGVWISDLNSATIFKVNGQDIER